MHSNSRLLFTKHALPLFSRGASVLEIGPDRVPSSFREMVHIDDLTWHTLDIFDSPHLTYPKSELYHFEIPDSTYDIVLSAQVIEHVAQVWNWMREVARVTKLGGLVITINPV